VSGRLEGFTFEVERKDGTTTRETFYAPAYSRARDYARSWAKERGHTVRRMIRDERTDAARGR
jgi:hypothetical protein